MRSIARLKPSREAKRDTGRSGASAQLARGTVIAAVSLAVAGGLLVYACSGPQTAAPSAGAPAVGSPARLPDGTTLLATLRGTAPRYPSPGRSPAGRVPGTWYGARSTLPVVASRPGWMQVRLARRPNGSTAWIPASDVKLSTTPYRIVVNLATTHLTLYKQDRKVFSAPVGVGTKTYPTPTGQYFLAFFEAPPESSSGYGAFIMVTSAHSETISNWAGSGDAVIGIHGPLDSSREIGTTGARVSHGCIRLHEADLLRLRDVPPGAPIDIVR